jgi:hypothetical protein
MQKCSCVKHLHTIFLLPISVYDSTIYFSNLYQQNQPFKTLLSTVESKDVTVHAKKAQWESKGITPPILNIQSLMEVCDQLHGPAALLMAIAGLDVSGNIKL